MNKEFAGTYPNLVCVTRHQGTVDFLLEKGFIDHDTPVITTNVTPSDIEGKVVIGVLPPHLIERTAAFFSLELDVPAEKRGQELTKDEVERYCKGIYSLRIVRGPNLLGS